MKVLTSVLSTAAIGVAASTLSWGLAAHAQELKQVNFMSSNHATCSVYPQFVAQELGFFADEGVSINLLNTNTTVPYVAFLQNGDADVAMLDSAQVLQAAEAGVPIKVVYEAYQHAPDGIYVLADSEIQSLADLRDTTIGLASDRDLITTVIAVDSIDETLEGMNISTAVIGDSGPVMANALIGGQVQAFAGSSTDKAGIEAAGVLTRSITPAEVLRNPGNSFAVWGPTMEEKRDIITGFLRGWAQGQHSGVLDTKLAASACAVHIPEQFENPQHGFNIVSNGVYVNQLRRTKEYGELQPDVWTAIQRPYVKQGEISGEIDPAVFLDSSFIEAANSWTTDDVKENMNAWKEANPDKLIN
jgi:NitT/TauT family transport system substrate-binding protein